MDSLGNYRILRTLSRRGTTSVYLAEHRVLGRKCVLKVYSGGDATVVQRFEREARIVAALASEAIVAVYDYGEVEGKFYLSLEYVDGYNLSEYLQTHRLTAAEIVALARRIAACVAIVHAHGYIHRDLKPENILIARSARVKLTDFGVAWHHSLKHVTLDGGLVGTPLYLSPEQINNLPFTPRSDVFALGIIFYQVATGTHPFEATHYGEIFAKILSHQPQPAGRLNPDLPAWFADLIAQLLQKEPGDRPQDAQEIVRIIDHHAAGLSPPAGEARALSSPKRWATGATLVAAAIALLFLLIWNLSREHPGASAPAGPHTALPTVQPDSTPASAGNHAEKTSFSRESTFPGKAVDATREGAAVAEKPAAVATSPALAERGSQADTPASLLIKTWPWCKIFLNNRHVETTPMTAALAVAPGHYQLSLHHPAYPVWHDSIVVLPNTAYEFGFNLDSLFFQVELQVTPWGEVFVDDAYAGTTPLPSPLLFDRRRRQLVRVENPFYQTWVDTLAWDGRSRIVMKIVLREKS
ncbi:MAG: serine/threonine protein kinase [candidate division KSB1 bacterium]|nr:serine/threonine protein kinase [candidate division KSB1 bacterium]MDZ7276588.1 serine/threonine protein kinase [candidate division KSB1 bacterium]MDZ7288239.1 serine/threonine protein kinase [candidate division KSB1 bacterium]MDZ7300370.1 serine/threonine protein kinase [candidate division KSB1 bacterium]MDZ7309239.1 serine/threonine protein kinase [candidate division KSB1 bacterium]